MKIFWKIVGAIILFLIILIVGVDLYFTDARLKSTVLPRLNAAVGRPVHVGHMSLSFFKTFPHPGIAMDNIYLPGKTDNDTLFSANRLVTGVKLFPLFSNRVDITELDIDRPKFTYKVYADSSTNLDFLLNQPADTSSSKSYDVNIPYFEISNGRLSYDDATSHTFARLDDLDGDLSLHYADSIATDINVEAGGLTARVDSSTYASGLPVSLSEQSTVFPDREHIRLKKGHFSIRGLKLDLSGAISNWSKQTMVNLHFKSSSDDFGELLRLVPKSYHKYSKGLKTKGSLALSGTIDGAVAAKTTPDFNILITVKDGYIKNPDLPKPIQNIRLTANATNKQLSIDTLNALAGASMLRGSGTLNNPLDEKNRSFHADFLANVDLATVHQFYDLSKMKVDRLGGRLHIDAGAAGDIDHPENARFNGKAILTDGLLKYEGVPKALDHINIKATGTQALLTIQKLGLQAGKNSLSARGKIQHLLDEKSRRINNMRTNLRFDLATLKDFYPMNKDTLRLAGQLAANATLDGPAGHIERAVQSGHITLKNGLIDYHKFDEPIRDISFESVLDGPRMTITRAALKTGDNTAQASGVIDHYLSKNRTVNLKTQGRAKLTELANYYDLKPDIKSLSGDANFNLSVRGPLNTPVKLDLSGKLSVKKGAMSGESLREAVKNLNGTINLSPQKATLQNLSFSMGASDFDLKGSLSHYMQYLKEEKKRSVTPRLTGQYHSKYLNLDELIDWSDTTSVNFSVKLPDVNSDVTARVDRLKILGATMQNLKAKATTTPHEVHLVQGSVDLFEGHATGTMRWQIPDGKPSTFEFKGSLAGLRLKSFFKQYPILGEDSRFYKYISGNFSSKVDYKTKIDTHLNPLMATTVLDGSFSMRKARVEDHPLQQKLARYTRIDQLNDVRLDNWQSTVSVNDNVLTINNLQLTSQDIGLQMNGTQNLETDKINFHVALKLPGRFKDKIGSVLGSEAAAALGKGNGELNVPLQVTGTYGNPTVSPDQSVIKKRVRQNLKNKAKNTLKNLLHRGNKNQRDTTKADSTETH